MTTPAKVQRYDLPRCGDPDCEMMERAEEGYYIEASDYDALARAYLALAEELNKMREVCAAAYQLAGTVGAPVRFLDALFDAANGEPGKRTNLETLLPVDLTECDEFVELSALRSRVKRVVGEMRENQGSLTEAEVLEWADDFEAGDK